VPLFQRQAINSLAEAVRQFEAEFEIADIADEDVAVTGLLLDLLNSRTIRGKQIHDANIVAVMRRDGIPLLLTHNTADFTRYGALHQGFVHYVLFSPLLQNLSCL
jgi:hypothetical protein